LQKIQTKKAFSGFWEEGPFGGEPNGPVWKKFCWGSQKHFLFLMILS